MAKNKEIHKFYMSNKWKRVRNAFYIEKEGICERCNKVVGRKEYQVHHKIHLTLENYTNLKVALDHENLELLCIDCHNKEHDRFIKRKARVEFDGDGEIIF